MKRSILLILASCVAGTVGCVSGTLLETSKNVLASPMTLVRAATGPKAVSKILCLWEPAEGQGLDERPSRGFAGQIMFFAHGSPSPIKVDGAVKIFQYSNFDPDEIDPTPIHQFNFSSAALEVHRTDGTIGHSYNVFLPYVEKGNDNAMCALRVEIEDKDGRKVSSPYTEVNLAGRNTVRPSKAIDRGVVSKPAPRIFGGSESARKAQTAQAAVEQLDTLTITMPKSQR